MGEAGGGKPLPYVELRTSRDVPVHWRSNRAGEHCGSRRNHRRGGDYPRPFRRRGILTAGLPERRGYPRCNNAVRGTYPAGDEFGFSIAIGSGIVAVGARLDDDNGPNAGAAYLFDASTGAQIAKLLADDGAAGDEFGYAIAIDSGIVAVGAMRDDDNGFDSGLAYLFDATTGAQIAKLLTDDGTTNDNFGGSIAIDGDIVAVGAHAAWVGSLYLAGSAYLFDVSTGDQLTKLVADNAAVNNFFGSAIDIDNGLVAVGAWARSISFDHSGAAYVFDVSTGSQIAYIVPSDGHDRDHFGRSISIDNGVVAIGAHQDGDNGFNSGSAYLYGALTGTLINKVLASDGAVFDRFGSSIAIGNGVVAVGARGDEDNGADSGSAYVFGAIPVVFEDSFESGDITAWNFTSL